MQNKTLNFYNLNASKFAENTRNVNFSNIQERFLRYIPLNGRILDFGCGSGRDTKYFTQKGYEVDAVDGSEELCRIAGQYAGISVKRMLFQDLDAQDRYDGIWACASILHLRRDELQSVMQKMSNALKQDGFIYTSFKLGTFEGMRNGRYFVDFTEHTFKGFIMDLPCLAIEEQWITHDVRVDREGEQWLNLILRKWNTA